MTGFILNMLSCHESCQSIQAIAQLTTVGRTEKQHQAALDLVSALSADI